MSTSVLVKNVNFFRRTENFMEGSTYIEMLTKIASDYLIMSL